MGDLANSNASLLSSNTAYFIVLLQLGISITKLISLRKCIIRIASCNAIDKAIYSASVVERVISVFSLDFYMIRHLPYLMIYLVLEYTEAGSFTIDLSKVPAKSVSTKYLKFFRNI